MATKPPPNRRSFSGEWDEIRYLYHKILHWFYPLRDRRKALHFCERLEPLLKQVASRREAIFGEECWSLLHEVRGDLAKAIDYRENEIKLIRRLREISVGTPSEEFVLDGYDVSDLSDRLDLLACLYHDAGGLDKAISVLQESKQLCDEHGIRFDGKDLLRDFLKEKKRLSRDAGSTAEKRKRSPA